MRLRNLLDRLGFGRAPQRVAPGGPTPATARQMAAMIGEARADELGCDETYELLDLFAEKVAQGEDAASLMPHVQRHLEMCPDCREEFEALLQSIQATAN